MREQVIISAERAGIRHGDALGRNSSCSGLSSQSGSHVYRGWIRRGLQAECPEHLRAHLITLSANGRPEMHEKVSRIGPPRLAEERDTAWKDARRGPPPPGVQKSHRSRVGIEKIDGHAVGNGDRQQNPWVGRSVAVRGSLRLSNALADPVMNDDAGLVDLAGMYDRSEGQSLDQTFPTGWGQS